MNQATQSGGVPLGHDANGNLNSAGATTYAYSAENLLTTAPGVTLGYDPLGRLIELAAAATTRLLYDGGEIAAETTATGAILERYVRGPGDDEPLVWYHGPARATAAGCTRTSAAAWWR